MLSSRYHHHLWRIKDEFRKAVQERQEEERKLLDKEPAEIRLFVHAYFCFLHQMYCCGRRRR